MSCGWIRRWSNYDSNHSVVRGLEYYTGPVYEVELTFPSRARTESPFASARSRAAGATMD